MVHLLVKVSDKFDENTRNSLFSIDSQGQSMTHGQNDTLKDRTTENFRYPLRNILHMDNKGAYFRQTCCLVVRCGRHELCGYKGAVPLVYDRLVIP